MPTGRPLREHRVLTAVLQGCPTEDLETPLYYPRKLQLPLIELNLTALSLPATLSLAANLVRLPSFHMSGRS